MSKHTHKLAARPAMAAIAVTPLTAAHAVTCPGCGHTLLIAHPDYAESPDGAWLIDGDAVPGVFAGLTAAQRRATFDCELCVGTCHACHANYYVVIASFVDGPATYEELASGGFARNAVRYALCATAGREPWMMARYDAPRGTVRQHIFGPWPLADATDVTGPAGVSGCGESSGGHEWAQARRLLLTLWDGLAAARLPVER